MSSETLERILSVTLSEPMLEGVFPVAPSSQSAHSPPSAIPAQCTTSCAITSGITTTTATPSASDYSTTLSVEPHLKRPKPDQSQEELFPTERDIDNFLDQIHH